MYALLSDLSSLHINYICYCYCDRFLLAFVVSILQRHMYIWTERRKKDDSGPPSSYEFNIYIHKVDISYYHSICVWGSSPIQSYLFCDRTPKEKIYDIVKLCWLLQVPVELNKSMHSTQLLCSNANKKIKYCHFVHAHACPTNARRLKRIDWIYISVKNIVLIYF